MCFKRFLSLILAAIVGCQGEPPAPKPLPEWVIEEMPKMESLAGRAKEALLNAEAIELIFLIPDENYGPPKKEPDVEYFNWWKVVSRVALDEKQRSDIASLLTTDVDANWKKGLADCFEPRHALRVTTPDGPFDIVLCFHCVQLWCFDKDGNRLGSQVGISESLQPALNKLKPAKNESKTTQ